MKADKTTKKPRIEYGLARTYVAQNMAFIKAELKKRRTVRSIWAELTQEGTNTVISYRSFLYNVSTMIVNNQTIDFQSAALAKQAGNARTNAVADSFQFSTQINSEDII